jgi:hypothetical protein
VRGLGWLWGWVDLGTVKRLTLVRGCVNQFIQRKKMKKTNGFVLMVLSLCCWLLFPQQGNVKKIKKDILEITSLIVTPGVIEGGIGGISIELQANIAKREDSGVPSIFAFVYRENNQPVQAAVLNSRHNINGRAGSEKTGFILKFPVKFFVPYYILDLKEGKQPILLKISANIKYGAAEPEELECRGKTSANLNINKPAVRKFHIMVRELRVDEKTLQDNNWDNGGGSSGLPDLRYKIEAGSKSTTDILYTSNTVKNSLSAAWIDYSGILTISEGDIISIVVYDKDTMFDDPIGRIKFNLEELKKVADKGEKIRFGLVNSCLIAVKITR